MARSGGLVIGQLARGVRDAFAGARFVLARPRLWKFVLAPALVTLAIVAGIVAGGVAVLGAPVAALVAILPGDWAESVVKVLLGVLLAIASFSLFFGIAAMIAAPFNEMLSEAIEEELTGATGERFAVLGFVRDIVVGIAHAARRVIVYLFVMLALLALGVLIPVIGTLAAAILGAIATARFASYDAYDAVWSRRRLAYRSKVEALREARWRSLGLGACIAAGAIVPGVNLFVLSVGAAGATLAALENRAPLPAARAAASRET